MTSAIAAELALLKGQRDRLLDQARAIDRKIGHLAGQAVQDESATKSSIGRVLGISHTHVTNLIAAADEHLATPSGIPVLDNVLAGNYVRERGARIIRSISAFEERDVLFQSGLDPRLFVNDDYGTTPAIPAMLWRLTNHEWLGVGQATVGYGGIGCGYSHQALVRAGVDEATADEIIQWRFCDAVNLDNRDSWHTSTIWPVHARSLPSVIENHIIVNIYGSGRPATRNDFIAKTFGHDENGQDPSGFYPSRSDLAPFDAWLNFLNDPGDAEWARGPRVARVFLDESVALAQGFAVLDPGSLSRSKSVPKIVIEQGDVQIWGHFLRPLDRNLWLPEEAYQALHQAGVYPAELAGRDIRNTRPLRRLLNSLIDHAPTQPYIDISTSGTAAQLAFIPRQPTD